MTSQDDPRVDPALVAQRISDGDLFAQSLGIRLESLAPGRSRASMALQPHMVNGHGLPHGAAIFALADFAFAAACNSHGRVALALSMDIHFLAAPAPHETLYAVAEEIRLGHRTGLYRIQVRDSQGTLIAELHGMAYRKEQWFLTPEGMEEG